MTSKEYITFESEEKEAVKKAKKLDPRFADESRITDGAYIALLARSKIEELDS